MTTPTINEHGVDTTRLAEEIERWIAGEASRTAALLAVRSGVSPEGIRQIRRHTRPRCTLDWADRLTLAMDIPLNDVAPWPPPPGPAVARRTERARRPSVRRRTSAPPPALRPHRSSTSRLAKQVRAAPLH